MIIKMESNFSRNKAFFTQNKLFKINNKNTNADNSLGTIKSKKQIREEIMKEINDMFDPTSKMSDEEKAAYDKKIDLKIKNGDKLSNDEMLYIKMKNPYMYAQIYRVQIQRQALESKLKSCHSKQEVQEVYADSISQINKDDPAKVPLQAAYNNVTQEFKKTSKYSSLPEKKDDVNKKEKKPVAENHMAEESVIESKYLQSEREHPIVDIMT